MTIYLRRFGLAVAALVLTGLMQVPSASAAGTPPNSHPISPTAATPAPSSLADPDRQLPPGWRASPDRAVTAVGDENGFHLLVANAAAGYQWYTAATLSEPGFDTSQWIGQDCVTGSGNFAAVVYAPRELTDLGDAYDTGAFVAVVDLRTGKVKKLALHASLAYYDPGCGVGDVVAISDLRDGKTDIDIVDATTGAITGHVSQPGQLTSAVPYAGQIAAVTGDHLVAIDAAGTQRILSTESATPFRVHPDADGGLGFEVPSGAAVQVRRFAAGRSRLVTTALASRIQVTASGGRVFLVGTDAPNVNTATVAPSWSHLDAPVNTVPSTLGQLVVTGSATHDATEAGTGPSSSTKPDHRIDIQAKVTGTGQSVSFSLIPAPARPDGSAPSPLIGGPALGHGTGRRPPQAGRPAATVDPGTVTWDPDRGCSVPRNDPNIQTFQATAQQVEWAADLAVQGQLTPARTANWMNSGMPVSWTPQGMFPLRALSGGGIVPAQVLLGILAQESNTMQASPHAVDGETGNFNQGGFYGNGASWSTVDCGYGIGQVTTGMAINVPAGTPVADGNMAYTTAEQQQAIATDYASNIAASLNMLIDAWNQLKAAGIIANDGNPAYIENWYLAAWAYNSGVQPTAALGNTTGCTPSPSCTDSMGDWGLGWANNPANPKYPSDRGTFTNSPADTKVPNHWPYQELVMGWAASPLPRFDYSLGNWAPSYAPGAWPGGSTTPVLPSFMTFCSTDPNRGDNCTPNGTSDQFGHSGLAGLCTAALTDHCWWHTAVNWTTCANKCGLATATYTVDSARPGYLIVYPPDGCTSTGLPSNAVIVGDGATSPSCFGSRSWTPQGSMTFDFPATTPPGCTPGVSVDCIFYQGKVDFHQLGVGFGGHVWFTHMDNSPTVTATWTPPPTVTGWTRIEVHVPSNAATTEEADYQISLGNGQHRHRTVNQHWDQNTWVDLGSFDLANGASVQLSNANSYVPTGDGGDVAFDAVAFVPTQQPVVDYVALGDSYSSGEGLQPYLGNSDVPADACHRSDQAYSYGITLPGHSSPIAAEAANNRAADFAFLACSGAETINMTADAVDPNNTENTDWGKANAFDRGEPYQIDDTGYLDQDTTLVTLSIGGNDARFADIIKGCIVTLTDCTAPDYKLTRGNGKVDPAPLYQYEPYIINLEKSHLEAVYNAVHAQAPNARIIVLGYPQLFQDNPSTCQALTAVDQTWMNQMSVALTTAISGAVGVVKQSDPTINISFVDPSAAFAGHRICDTDAWINGIIPVSKSGSGTDFPGTGSFHPMAPGHAAEAALINGTL